MRQGSKKDHCVKTLAEDGVVSIEGYLDPDICEEIRTKIQRALEQDEITVSDDMDYQDKVHATEPVMNVRGGDFDQGMRDIYNADYIAPQLEEIKEDDFVHEIIENATGKSYTPLHINAYVNRSVTSTRPFHADTYGGLFKAFVYLTDVPNESYGPFAYIRGTHDPSFVKRKITGLVNKYNDNPSTDAVFFDEDNKEIFTAPKGTLIISDQSGYHQGMPQEEGRERFLVNTQYQPNK